MNRREFGKGAVLSAIAGLLGIGAKASRKRSVVHGKSGSLSINGLLVAGEGAKTTLAPCPSPEFEPTAHHVDCRYCGGRFELHRTDGLMETGCLKDGVVIWRELLWSSMPVLSRETICEDYNGPDWAADCVVEWHYKGYSGIVPESAAQRLAVELFAKEDAHYMGAAKC